MKALLISGTGVTGPLIARQILERGVELAIYHRGVHEVPLPPEIEHIHSGPHFVESIEHDLADRRFDLVVATYGRIRHLPDSGAAAPIAASSASVAFPS